MAYSTKRYTFKLLKNSLRDRSINKMKYLFVILFSLLMIHSSEAQTRRAIIYLHFSTHGQQVTDLDGVFGLSEKW
ncbi:MAG: hypothetical protein AAB347_00910 [Bacteroidota bacterium]